MVNFILLNERYASRSDDRQVGALPFVEAACPAGFGQTPAGVTSAMVRAIEARDRIEP